MDEGKCETIVFFLDSNSFKKETNGQQLSYSFFLSFLEWFEATIKNSFKYKTKEKRKSWKLLGTKFSVSAFDLRFRRYRQRAVDVVIVVVAVAGVAVVVVVVVAVDEGFLPRGSSLFLTSFRRKKILLTWSSFLSNQFFFHRRRGRCRRRWGQRRPNNVDSLRTAETRDPPPGGQTGCAFSRNWTTSRIGKIGKISWSTSLTTLPIKIFETQTSFVTTQTKESPWYFKKFFTNTLLAQPNPVFHFPN